MMRLFPYIFLFPFWIGMILLSEKDSFDLKKRSFHFDRLEFKNIENELRDELSLLYQKFFGFIQKDRMIKEFSDVLSYIKNIVILGNAGSISSQSLCEKLSDECNLLKTVFIRMASFLSLNEKEKAAEYFSSCMGDFLSDAGSLISGWEDIEPQEILETIDVYQSSIRNEILSKTKRRNEILSDLIYYPVVLNCMLVLLNFIYVAYYIEQKEMLFILM